MSFRLVLKARMAMHSLATEISKPVSLVWPFSVGAIPTLIPRRCRSFTSRTLRQVMVSGSMSRRANRRISSSVSSFGSVFSMPSFFSLRKHNGGEFSFPILGRHQAAVEWPILLCVLVEHAGLDRSGKEIVGGGDGVDITGEVQIELIHGDNLTVPSTCGPALDAKGRTLARLSDVGKGETVEMGSQRPGPDPSWSWICPRRAAWE